MAIDTNTFKGKLVVGGIGVVTFLVGILIGHLVPPKPIDLDPKIQVITKIFYVIISAD